MNDACTETQLERFITNLRESALTALRDKQHVTININENLVPVFGGLMSIGSPDSISTGKTFTITVPYPIRKQTNINPTPPPPAASR